MDNFSYKIVSLLIALILWLTILGRRDFVITKVLEVEIISKQDRIVLSQSDEAIKVKVAGPRTALKKFIESGFSQLVVIDIGNKEGSFEVDVPVQKIDVPFGVKVLSVKPTKIKVQAAAKSGEK